MQLMVSAEIFVVNSPLNYHHACYSAFCIHTENMMQLGFVGVGTIDTPRCLYLIEAGRIVMAYDVNEANLSRIVKGAQAADRPRVMAQACEVVLSSLRGLREAEQVALEEDGIIAAT